MSTFSQNFRKSKHNLKVANFPVSAMSVKKIIVKRSVATCQKQKTYKES